jgi:hypothetical protein
VTATVQPITVAEIVKVYGVAPGYVYRLASLHQWRRIMLGSRVYYDLSEADPVLRNLPSVKSRVLLTLA